MKKNRKVKTETRYAILCSVAMFIYAFRHVRYGVELTDTGYSLGNFIFYEQMDGMWRFATYLANVIGAFFTNLPFGNYMLAMNVYTGLVVVALAISGWLFMVYKMNVPKAVALLGELLALSLCWCPTTILYNYLTYLFLNIGAILLYLGLASGENDHTNTIDKRNQSYLFLAGLFLGINVFVRFPNIVEVVLIFAVWYACFQEKLKIQEYIYTSLWCIFGYAVAIMGILGGIFFKYGFKAYFRGIRDLFAMQAEAPDYTPQEMIWGLICDYKEALKWLSFFLLGAVLVGLLDYGIKKVPVSGRKVIAIVIGALVSLFVAYYLYRQGNFNIKYDTYESMFMWVAIFIALSVFILVVQWLRPGSSRNEKILSLILLIVIGVTPLGSNNRLFPNMNNMFLVYPYIICLLIRYAQFLLHKYENVGFSAVVVSFLLLMSIQVLGFGMFFVFRVGISPEKKYPIEGNQVLKGMLTTQENADAISSLTEYIDTQGYEGQRVVLYGNIPSISYYLKLQPAISTTWPDLRSYSYGKMEQEIGNLGDEDCMILFSPEVQKNIEEYETKKSSSDNNEYFQMSDPKLNLLRNRIETYNYKIVFRNEKFVLYAQNH